MSGTDSRKHVITTKICSQKLSFWSVFSASTRRERKTKQN